LGGSAIIGKALNHQPGLGEVWPLACAAAEHVFSAPVRSPLVFVPGHDPLLKHTPLYVGVTALPLEHADEGHALPGAGRMGQASAIRDSCIGWW
jgi:hypothetical protein